MTIKSYRKVSSWFNKTKGVILQYAEEVGYSSHYISELRETKAEVSLMYLALVQTCNKELAKYLVEFIETGQDNMLDQQEKLVRAKEMMKVLAKQQELLVTHLPKK